MKKEKDEVLKKMTRFGMGSIYEHAFNTELPGSVTFKLGHLFYTVSFNRSSQSIG